MANTTENTDVIQDIDDPCDEEYVENFAPKAQEEILSELQDNNQIDEGEQISCQTDENASSEEITQKNNEPLESNDNLNEEEIHETSDLLIKQVITDAESNLNTDEEFHVTEDYKSDINIDNSQDSETNIETVDSDEKNVDVEMEEPSFEADVNIQKNEEKEEETVNIETNEEPNLPEMKENIEVQSEPKSEEIQEEVAVEAESDHAVEVDNEKAAEVDNEKAVEVDNVDVEKTEVTVSPTKGKDVKSLSSTYGHEENITNGDCCICNKIVYPMEKLSTNDRLYHKICFRCTKCKNALSTGNFTFNQGKPYCTPHYVELFKKRGRYDEIDNNVEAEHCILADNNENIADELPAPHTTKNIVAKFSGMHTNAGDNTNSAIVADSSDELPPPNTLKNLKEHFTALGQEKPESKCKPKIDIPRHANGHANGSSENEPIVLSKDVVRSNDPGQDDKPEQGITKNLVSRFSKMDGASAN